MLKQFKKIFSLLNYAYPVILGLSVSFFISSIFYYKFNVITPAENSFSKSEIRKNKNSVDIDFILKTNFFGIKTEEKPVNIPEKEVEKPLPKKNEEILEITDEKFNGKLIGIITGKENLALITFKNKFLLLRLNKKIDDITLKKISPNEIVVAYQGKNYKLVLNEDKYRNLKQKTSKSGKSHGAVKSEKIKIKKGVAVAQLRDVNRFMRDVVVFPYYKNKQFIGYKISRIARGSILRRAGLLPGDVLIQVNGESIKSPQKFPPGYI